MSFVPSSARASAVAARMSRGGLHPAGHWREDAVLGAVSVCLGAGRGSLRGVRRPGNPVRPLGRWGAGQDGY